MARGLLAPILWAGGCGVQDLGPASQGRVTARPRGRGAQAPGAGPPTTGATASRSRALGLGASRDATLQLPAVAPGTTLPLIVLLHGAGGSGEGILRRLGSACDAAGLAVLAPDSRGATWDAIRGYFGPDVMFLNRALDKVFAEIPVDPSHICVGGFSDGATYALTLGLVNGDLFSRIAAFSPGFLIEGAPQGHPRFFLSHGTADSILPIDQCSRRIVPELRRRGYDVTYREFSGDHDVPAEVAAEGLAWTAKIS